MKIKYAYSLETLVNIEEKVSKYCCTMYFSKGYPYKCWIYTRNEYEELQDYYCGWGLLERRKNQRRMKSYKNLR